MSKFEDQINDLLTGGDRLVTRHMADWDGVMTPSAIMQVANQEIIDNSDAYDASDGRGRIRPSNLASPCTRLHVLSWLGAPNHLGDETLMEDGTQQHYVWQKKGLSSGFLRDIEVPIEVPSLGIRGRLDGLMVDGSVFEFKETGPKLYEQRLIAKEPTHAHLLQVHAYMKGLGVDRASVVYESRSYGVQWHEFRVQFDPEIWKELKALCWPVLEATENGVMPPMRHECTELSGPIFKKCGYNAVCPSAEFSTTW
jgi:hypothetical protein